MTVVVECTIPPSSLPLGAGFAAGRNLRVALERIVPAGDGPPPDLWVRGDGIDGFVAALREQPSIDGVTVLDRFGDRALVRVGWAPPVPAFLEQVATADVRLVGLSGTSERWTVQLRAGDHGAIEAFHEGCADAGIDVSLDRLRTLARTRDDDRPYGLTETQLETLLAAYRAGYFEDPRETSLEALGDRFDVSARAVSKRLRGGLATLIGEALAPRDVRY